MPMILFSGILCKDADIGMEKGHIADIRPSSPSVPGFEAQKARLNGQSAWCALSDSSSYLQVDLNANYLICAIATQGNGNSSVSAFVKEYKVEFSINGADWDFYRGLAGGQV